MALSEPGIIATLNEHFVSTWILAKDLEATAESEAVDPDVRRHARLASERYTYPVDTQIVAPGGELIASAASNDMRDMIREYRRLLDTAVTEYDLER